MGDLEKECIKRILAGRKNSLISTWNRMNKKEFRANLYRTYVSSGMHDHILIQKNIEIAESFVFDKHGITAFDLNKINIAMAEGTRQSNGSYALGKT